MIALFYFTLNFTIQFIQFGAYHNYIYKVPCSFLYALLCIALYINRARILQAVLFIACCRLSLPVLCAYSLICSFAVPVAVVAPCPLSLFLQLFGILWPAAVCASRSVSLSSQLFGILWPAVACRFLSCVPIRSYVLLPHLLPLSLPVPCLYSFSCSGSCGLLPLSLPVLRLYPLRRPAPCLLLVLLPVLCGYSLRCPAPYLLPLSLPVLCLYPFSCPAPCLLSLWFPVPLSSQVFGILWPAASCPAPILPGDPLPCVVFLFLQLFRCWCRSLFYLLRCPALLCPVLLSLQVSPSVGLSNMIRFGISSGVRLPS